jgi:hypothetical protein
VGVLPLAAREPRQRLLLKQRIRGRITARPAINGTLTVIAPVDARYTGTLATLMGSRNTSLFNGLSDLELQVLGWGVNIDDNEFLKGL